MLLEVFFKDEWFDNFAFLNIREVLQQVDDLMLIHYAVPIMLSLVGLEIFLGYITKRQQYSGRDLAGSVMIGLGNLLTTAITKIPLFILILWCITIVPWRIPNTWWSYVLCLVSLDFFRYWAHRVAHEQRIWWATHVPHHSSEKYNFSVSFRLSWVQQFKAIFFLPVAFMGFDPLTFFIIHQIEVLYQFWIHTEFIRKLPKPIEYIFTTPSHHRVHHAVNKKYMDRNYGSTFIIWDRIFGTFQPEEEQAVYGITKPLTTINPLVGVFHEFAAIGRDFSNSKGLKQRLRVLFGSPNNPSSYPDGEVGDTTTV